MGILRLPTSSLADVQDGTCAQRDPSFVERLSPDRSNRRGRHVWGDRLHTATFLANFGYVQFMLPDLSILGTFYIGEALV